MEINILTSTLIRTIFYYDMYARHDVIIESACLWLEDVKSNGIQYTLVLVAGLPGHHKRGHREHADGLPRQLERGAGADGPRGAAAPALHPHPRHAGASHTLCYILKIDQTRDHSSLYKIAFLMIVFFRLFVLLRILKRLMPLAGDISCAYSAGGGAAAAQVLVYEDFSNLICDGGEHM